MEGDILKDNLSINKKNGTVQVSVNPKLYSMQVIYGAAYKMTDDAYVMLDGDLNEEILVDLKPKTKMDPEILGREFNNELVQFAAYMGMADKNREIRDTIIKKAVTSAAPEMSYVDDPLGIAKPWSEK